MDKIESIQVIVMHELEATGERITERQEMLMWKGIPESLRSLWEQDIQRFVGICDGLAWVIHKLETID